MLPTHLHPAGSARALPGLSSIPVSAFKPVWSRNSLLADSAATRPGMSEASIQQTSQALSTGPFLLDLMRQSLL